MSFGETLRAAREAKGLTCSEVAMQTRLLVQIVEEMEQEDFHRIAAPIYGRGFVRLYASCVGLDPTPLVAEFMEIYEGHRAPIVKTRAVPTTQEVPAPQQPSGRPPVADYAPPADPPPPPPMPDFTTRPVEVPAKSEEPVATSPIIEPHPEETIVAGPEAEPILDAPSPTDEAPVSAEQESPALPETQPSPVDEPPVDMTSVPDPTVDVEPPPEPAPVPEPPPALRGLDLFEQAYANQQGATVAAPPRDALEESPFLPPSYEEEEGPSASERFRQGLSNVSLGILTTVKRIPRSTWRFSFLGLSSVAVVVLLAFACVKLYQFTTPPTQQQSDAPVEQQVKQNAVGPQKTPTTKPTPATTSPKATKVAQPARPKVPGALRSTGQKIPSLYVD